MRKRFNVPVLACLAAFAIAAGVINGEGLEKPDDDLCAKIKSRLFDSSSAERPIVLEWKLPELRDATQRIDWNLFKIRTLFEDPLTAREVIVKLVDPSGKTWWSLDNNSARPSGNWTSLKTLVVEDFPAMLKNATGFQLIFSDTRERIIFSHPVEMKSAT
ncbi:MAG TPA: hypothetical protein ENN40_06245 [Candidatus Aminicenantes bacterium]|nr:hypothetical protein [Candidatus Aminicenantes bacterium]